VVLFVASMLVFIVALFHRWGPGDPSGSRPAPVPPALGPSTEPLLDFREDFSGPVLDPARWIPTKSGEFQDRRIDLVEIPGENPRRFRLRLRASTLGSREDTVHVLGVRTAAPLRLGRETRASADLDWNSQANGSYLSAAIILSPLATDGNPLTGPDWIRIEYVGVPPGKNGRLVIASRTAGIERPPFQEGWPKTNRTGRPIGLQKLTLVVRGTGFELLENGQPVYECTENVIRFPSAYLYLQMASHCNYPPREIFFDHVRWSGTP
jgi:hypothetical protein